MGVMAMVVLTDTDTADTMVDTTVILTDTTDTTVSTNVTPKLTHKLSFPTLDLMLPHSLTPHIITPSLPPPVTNTKANWEPPTESAKSTDVKLKPIPQPLIMELTIQESLTMD